MEDKCCKSEFDNQCCCECKLLLKLYGHPHNTETGFKDGKICYGYACMLYGAVDNNNHATFFDNEHNICECFIKR